MKVTLLAYRDHIVVLPDAATLDPNWEPSGNRKHGNFMQSILFDTETNLRASEAALNLLARIPNGRELVGDWDWFRTDDGTYACSWFGPIFRLIDPRGAVTARGAEVYRDRVVVVPNYIPPELSAEVDAALARGDTYYREPFALSDPEPPEMNN